MDDTQEMKIPVDVLHARTQAVGCQAAIVVKPQEFAAGSPDFLKGLVNELCDITTQVASLHALTHKHLVAEAIKQQSLLAVMDIHAISGCLLHANRLLSDAIDMADNYGIPKEEADESRDEA